MRIEQLPLLPGGPEGPKYNIPVLRMPELSPESSLAAAIGGFHGHMSRGRFTENTVKAFLGDLRLLGRYMSWSKPIREIGTKDLNDFLTYLRYHRGIPCTTKSYGRRVTTLKVFFGWLAEENLLSSDPAAPLIHEPASSPLPEVLYDSQVESLLLVTRAMMAGEKPDARPHLLVTLLLHTGIKKSECMGMKVTHIDISDPHAPVLYIRYDEPRRHKKERKLSLPAEFAEALPIYLERYAPKEHLFECTPRNLEYVLTEAGQRAGMSQGVSFEALRMTCAVHDYRGGMPSDRLREKLGLSKITWREKAEQIKTLAAPPL